jgi:hypothetical protein
MLRSLVLSSKAASQLHELHQVVNSVASQVDASECVCGAGYELLTVVADDGLSTTDHCVSCAAGTYKAVNSSAVPCQVCLVSTM